MSRVAALETAVGSIQNRLNGLQQQVNALSQRVANLENFNKWRGVNITVDCTAGQTVAAALQQAAAYQSASIGIKGVCAEAVQINNNNTFMYGVGPGDGLALPASNQGQSLLSISASGVVLNNLTLTGGSHTLHVTASAVRVSNTTVAGSGFHGIFMNGGQLELMNSTVTGSAGAGVFAWAGATVHVIQSSIMGGSGTGLLLDASNGFIDNGSMISGNREGISLYNGASVHLRIVTISGHSQNGVVAQGASSVVIDGGTVVTDNAGHGILLQDTSVMGMWGSSLETRITNNGQWGVFCSETPAVAQITPSSFGEAVVTGNAAGQVRCPGY
jgi:hypothetical protein